MKNIKKAKNKKLIFLTGLSLSDAYIPYTVILSVKHIRFVKTTKLAVATFTLLLVNRFILSQGKIL